MPDDETGAAAVADVADHVIHQTGNADVDWDQFDSQAYFAHNYGSLRKDDAEIISIMADFFAANLSDSTIGHAIDVGSGTNLYPALTMLPYASRVTLYERAHTNRDWLRHSLERPQSTWLQFWDQIASDRPGYQRITRPLELLADRAEVTRGNVFDLKANRYHMGTMFFVAESITTRDDEFRRATRLFVDSLVPNSPFAAAFMLDSSGYVVAGRHFPACMVSENDVRGALEPVARRVEIRMVDSNDLRDGYGGMMVATGRKK
ncbi:SCO2525 family SAM-dependent methyltransferase [Paractinoplanes ferrugineus]|uniref:SCO2525 family SAM-dependent methyltransferase n=1 Tax=Paractinoplanes ferrugineus TaxID=113564 RepID=UPI001941F1C7|nr:SCO2525 family SAM-dependent methyltransferase [Actinoplanes ferrugineus]